LKSNHTKLLFYKGKVHKELCKLLELVFYKLIFLFSKFRQIYFISTSFYSFVNYPDQFFGQISTKVIGF